MGRYLDGSCSKCHRENNERFAESLLLIELLSSERSFVKAQAQKEVCV
jgi:hypothetical protein